MVDICFRTPVIVLAGRCWCYLWGIQHCFVRPKSKSLWHSDCIWAGLSIQKQEKNQGLDYLDLTFSSFLNIFLSIDFVAIGYLVHVYCLVVCNKKLTHLIVADLLDPTCFKSQLYDNQSIPKKLKLTTQKNKKGYSNAFLSCSQLKSNNVTNYAH
jgi:hypothetical protein